MTPAVLLLLLFLSSSSSSFLGVKGQVEMEGSVGQKSGGVRGRVRRNFIIPGTLWCGSGNRAPSYHHLGHFSTTDSCCREHDQCKHTILSFHWKYGVFNSNVFTMSHCDCDDRFRRCLQAANDRISEAVGFTFFNVLKMQCFQFSHRLQCSQRNWFGRCKESKMTLYAKVFPPTQYESTESSSNHSLNTTPPTSPPSSSSSSSSSSPVRPEDQSGSSVLQVNSLSVQNQSESRHNAQPADVTSSCGAFRDLDECQDVILPQQTKYGLYNPDDARLYHCNCTRRLFQAVALQGEVTPVQNFLLTRVSPSCFLLKDCKEERECAALLVKAEFTPWVQQGEQQPQQVQQQQVQQQQVQQGEQQQQQQKVVQQQQVQQVQQGEQQQQQVMKARRMRRREREGNGGRGRLSRLCFRLSRTSNPDLRQTD